MRRHPSLERDDAVENIEALSSYVDKLLGSERSADYASHQSQILMSEAKARILGHGQIFFASR